MFFLTSRYQSMPLRMCVASTLRRWSCCTKCGRSAPASFSEGFRNSAYVRQFGKQDTPQLYLDQAISNNSALHYFGATTRTGGQKLI